MSDGLHVHVYFVTGLQEVECPPGMTEEESLEHALDVAKSQPRLKYPDTQYIALIPEADDGARQ